MGNEHVMDDATTTGETRQKTRSEIYTEYINSPQWRVKRREALDRAGHKCQLCSSTNRLEVHHNDYSRLGNEIPSDLVALCYVCHTTFHDKLRPSKLKPSSKSATKPVPEKRLTKKQRRKVRKAQAIESLRAQIATSAPAEGITLTTHTMDTLRTKKGGYSAKVLSILGVNWPPPGGWRKALIGSKISRETYERAQRACGYVKPTAVDGMKHGDWLARQSRVRRNLRMIAVA